MPSPHINIHPVTALSSVEGLRPVLESAIRHPLTLEIIQSEVTQDLEALELSRRGESSRYYAIALNAGNVAVGMMGLQYPEKAMFKFVSTPNPVELINAYVLSEMRGAGVGRLLVRHLEDKARSEGHTELLLNSGPRYMRSGWPFWRKMYGEPVGVLDGYYDGYDAPVWRTSL